MTPYPHTLPHGVTVRTDIKERRCSGIAVRNNRAAAAQLGCHGHVISLHGWQSMELGSRGGGSASAAGDIVVPGLLIERQCQQRSSGRSQYGVAVFLPGWWCMTAPVPLRFSWCYCPDLWRLWFSEMLSHISSLQRRYSLREACSSSLFPRQREQGSDSSCVRLSPGISHSGIACTHAGIPAPPWLREGAKSLHAHPECCCRLCYRREEKSKKKLSCNLQSWC